MTRVLRQAKPRKRCPSCGAFNANDAAMCEMCGYLFPDAPPATRIQPTPPPSPPAEDELEEGVERLPELETAPLPRRPPNLPYWRPKPKPARRARQRLGIIVGAVALGLVALVGVLLVISGLSRVREDVASTPTSLPSSALTAQADTDEPAIPAAGSAPTETPVPTPTFSSSPTPVPTPTPEPTRPPRQTYVVQPGDSCFAIATRFGVQVSDLIVWNNLPDNCLIRAGQELFVSPP